MNFGQVAYEAYSRAVGGKSAVTGEPLPTWPDQDERIRAAWERAATAVIDAAGSPVPSTVHDHLKS